jgi:hypothetical protein
MKPYNWKAKPISPCLGAHEAHPKTTLYGVVFQKLNGPLLTSGRPAVDGDFEQIASTYRALGQLISTRSNDDFAVESWRANSKTATVPLLLRARGDTAL